MITGCLDCYKMTQICQMTAGLNDFSALLVFSVFCQTRHILANKHLSRDKLLFGLPFLACSFATKYSNEILV